jgi:hypothetical protein
MLCRRVKRRRRSEVGAKLSMNQLPKRTTSLAGLECACTRMHWTGKPRTGCAGQEGDALDRDALDRDALDRQAKACLSSAFPKEARALDWSLTCNRELCLSQVAPKLLLTPDCVNIACPTLSQPRVAELGNIRLCLSHVATSISKAGT